MLVFGMFLLDVYTAGKSGDVLFSKSQWSTFSFTMVLQCLPILTTLKTHHLTIHIHPACAWKQEADCLCGPCRKCRFYFYFFFCISLCQRYKSWYQIFFSELRTKIMRQGKWITLSIFIKTLSSGLCCCLSFPSLYV